MANTELISALQDRIESEISSTPKVRKRKTVEELCFSVLALRRRRGIPFDSALTRLSSLQLGDGSWPCFPGDDASGSYATALGIWALMTLGRHLSRSQSGVRWLLTAKGREANWLWRWKFQTIDTSVRFDPRKYGWSWTPGTGSWVIPTSFSLIALQHVRNPRLSALLNDRISMGVSMLLDRMCPGGGWNAGNGVAFGVALAPYIDATAIALLALQLHDDKAINASLEWLRARLPDCPSPHSLAWGILALAAYDKQGSEFGDSLEAASGRLITAIPKACSFMDTATLATCALALAALDGDNVFVVRA